ncbi:hypothetical protein LZ554_001441 [Drepanopeziza brunnea f. sp. 'monogermtubi']|nr:hypothetical protein LZ554_001441 [Drepanopeziza brunnea f. sp. 'monogermtubi']
MSPIPEYIGYKIDEEAWESKFHLASDNTTEKVNGYILLMLTCYQRRFRYTGTDLKELFQEDFEDWTSDTFALATKACCRSLWRHLLLNGVPIKSAVNGTSYKKVFMDVLLDLKPIEWTPEFQTLRESLMKKMEAEIGAPPPPPADSAQQQQQLQQQQKQLQQLQQKQLQQLQQQQLGNHIQHTPWTQFEAVANITGGKNIDDLLIKDAAFEASCIVDYLVRATDEKENKLPEKYRSDATLVEVGAGTFLSSGFWSRKSRDATIHPTIQAGPLSPTLSSQAGAVMIVAIHHIHNNPTIWDDPARFTPDRWNTEKLNNQHKTAYVPFAAGQRMCIGFNFALMEVRVIISMLVYRYPLEKVGNDLVEYDPSFQLIRPMNFYARAKKRTTWPEKSKTEVA